MTFQREILSLVPQLLAYARGLVRCPADAEDLVQDVIMRAWAAQDRYIPDTNMRAWLFTILRNRFYSKYTGQGGRQSTLEDVPEALLAVPPGQEWGLRQSELKAALLLLEAPLREALLLSVGAEMNYAEIGQVLGCPVGTVKSRVFRARRALAAILDGGIAQAA